MEPNLAFEKKFYDEIEMKTKLVQSYEDQALRNYALTFIPYAELRNKASDEEEQLRKKSEKVCRKDLIILELLKWYKFSFFRWIDIPKCESCHQKCVKKGMLPPTESELKWGATHVEHYFCTPCQKCVRFPRYNHPKKLLTTRQGRCGEWANCFTLLCRTLGYEARLVMDWNDHVWTEVFSETQNRWLHCDPCENICDKPLIYEIGWKKSITYIIAFSKDEIQDVTWRYTCNYSDVLSRRKLCREEFLLKCVTSFTNALQRTLSESRKKELQKRRISELVEFLTPPKHTNQDLHGRESGSLDWRVARGECITTSFIFKLSEREIKQRCCHVKYSCAKDKYIHVSDKSVEHTNWESCIFQYKGVFRKVENDWNTAYIARVEDSVEGIIGWKFDFKDSGLVINCLELKLCSRTFENGSVKWVVSAINTEGEEIHKMYHSDDNIHVFSYEFKGRTSFTITAKLTGGIGQVAWQHAQLFRQQLDSVEFPFEVQISLDKQ